MAPLEQAQSPDVGEKEKGVFVVQDEEPEKPIPKAEHVDRFGAHEKTDPKEIKLVKKLDRWIMVCHFLPAAWALFEQVLTFPRSSPCSGACTGSTTSTETPSPWPV